MMVGDFAEVCRSLKINADKSKVMVLDEEEGLKCDWGKCQSSNI